MIAPYSQKQMFELVNNVSCYPEFLPFCQSTHILSQSPQHLEARLTFAKGGFCKSFTTYNQLIPFECMDVQLIDGPFKRLTGHWQFIDYGSDRCQVKLDMEYEFDSKIFMILFGPLFHQVTNTLVDAFFQRAKQLWPVT